MISFDPLITDQFFWLWGEGPFDVAQGMHAAHCQTGEEYRAFTYIGDDPIDLFRKFTEDFEPYCRDRIAEAASRPTLYWRYAAPHVFWYPEDRKLTTRLVITAKPVV